jgi:hypothetical protein
MEIQTGRWIDRDKNKQKDKKKRDRPMHFFARNYIFVFSLPILIFSLL